MYTNPLAILLRSRGASLWVALTLGLLVSSTLAEDPRPFPEAFGSYIRLGPADFAQAKSFRGSERIVGTYYFYWYNSETGEHITNPQDGSDGLTDHPPTLVDFSYTSPRWHEQQFRDMRQAGIDIALPVFWGAPSERQPGSALAWSYTGLNPMVAGLEALLKDGLGGPKLGLFYDTSTLQFNAWHLRIDLTSDHGRRWFYATVRDFFSAIPPQHWAMIDGKPIILLYSADFAKNHDQSFIDYAKKHFKQDFGRDPYIAPQDSWRVTADNVCAWGGALGLKNPGIGEIGPGYDDRAVYGRKRLFVNRENGAFYERNWLKFLRSPSNFVMIETWNEFHEGTTICESREYGRQYIELTRKYVDLFKRGYTPPWPKGPYTGAAEVSCSPAQTAAGVRLVSHEDGPVTASTNNLVPCWVSKPPPGRSAYIYFQVDESFKFARSMDLELEINYLDAAPGTLFVEYDGPDKSAPFRGAYSRTTAHPLTGDGEWKTAKIALPRARLLGSQNGGADFRITAEAPLFAVRSLRLRR